MFWEVFDENRGANLGEKLGILGDLALPILTTTTCLLSSHFFNPISRNLSFKYSPAERRFATATDARDGYHLVVGNSQGNVLEIVLLGPDDFNDFVVETGNW